MQDEGMKFVVQGIVDIGIEQEQSRRKTEILEEIGSGMGDQLKVMVKEKAEFEYEVRSRLQSVEEAQALTNVLLLVLIGLVALLYRKGC